MRLGYPHVELPHLWLYQLLVDVEHCRPSTSGFWVTILIRHPHPDRGSNSSLRGSLDSPDPMSHDIRADVFQLLMMGAQNSEH